MDEQFEVVTRSGERLACTAFRPDGSGRFPAVVLFHGYGSRRMNDTNTALVQRLLVHNFAAFVADLSGHGDSTGDIAAQDIVRASKEVIDVVRRVSDEVDVDDTRIAVLGNSFSGAAAILAAPHLPVRALGLKAPACDWEGIWRGRIGTDAMQQWQEAGTFEASPGVRLDWSSVAAAKGVDVFAAFTEIEIPVRVWQGTADEIIPADSRHRLQSLCVANKTFVCFEGGNHGIGDAHFQLFLDDVESFFVDVLTTRT